jgi:hypothetical protein
MVDGTGNIQGWERDFFERLGNSLKRSELTVFDAIHITDPARFAEALNASTFNCLLLFALGESAEAPEWGLRAFWNELRAQSNLSPFLLAICSPLRFDPNVSGEVLKSSLASIPFAVAPQSPMTPREAGLFYLKFFTELKLHSSESITGKMVWFSFSKAKELLRRRRYSAKFGVRC